MRKLVYTFILILAAAAVGVINPTPASAEPICTVHVTVNDPQRYGVTDCFGLDLTLDCGVSTEPVVLTICGALDTLGATGGPLVIDPDDLGPIVTDVIAAVLECAGSTPELHLDPDDHDRYGIAVCGVHASLNCEANYADPSQDGSVGRQLCLALDAIL